MTEINDEEDFAPKERVRACAHRDILIVTQAWPEAWEDAQARGFGTGRSYDGAPRGGGELTSVEAAAVRPDFATAWLAELGDVLIEFAVQDLPMFAPGDQAEEWGNAVDFIIDNETPKYWNRATLRLRRLAASATSHWPQMPKKGETIHGITVGQRTSQAETCLECGEPVTSGRDPATGQPLLRRDKDGHPYHGAGLGCWWKAYRRHKAVERAK